MWLRVWSLCPYRGVCRFLSRALIPLHKPSGSCIQQYHQQLSYCITQYLEKDPKLADIILRGLIKYWPHTNSSKEVCIRVVYACELAVAVAAFE